MFIGESQHLLPPKDDIRSIISISSYDNTVIATSDKSIYIYNKDKRLDKFSVKQIPTVVAYNELLAVGQLDGYIHIYKLQDKKVICNKFSSSQPITHLVLQNDLLFVTNENKIKYGNLKSNKASTLYQSNATVTAFDSDFIHCYIGQIDGTILKMTVNDNPSHQVFKKCTGEIQILKICGKNIIFANESNLFICNELGTVLYQSEFSSPITGLCLSHNSEFLAIATDSSISILSLISFNLSKLPINLQGINTICYESNSQALLIGTIDGICDRIELIIKSELYNSTYLINYHLSTFATITNVHDNTRTSCNMSSPIQYIEISNFSIICKSQNQLVFTNILSNTTHTIPWHRNSNDELFMFTKYTFILVDDQIFISLNNQILTSIHCNNLNPNFISIHNNLICYYHDSQILIKQLLGQQLFQMKVGDLKQLCFNGSLYIQFTNNDIYHVNMSSYSRSLLCNADYCAIYDDFLITMQSSSITIYKDTTMHTQLPVVGTITKISDNIIYTTHNQVEHQYVIGGTKASLKQQMIQHDTDGSGNAQLLLAEAIKSNDFLIASKLSFELGHLCQGYFYRQCHKEPKYALLALNFTQFVAQFPLDAAIALSMQYYQYDTLFHLKHNKLDVNKLPKDHLMLYYPYLSSEHLHLLSNHPKHQYQRILDFNISNKQQLLECAEALQNALLIPQACDLYLKLNKHELAISLYLKHSLYTLAIPLIKDNSVRYDVQHQYLQHLMRINDYSSAYELAKTLQNEIILFDCCLVLNKPISTTNTQLLGRYTQYLMDNGLFVRAASICAPFNPQLAISIYCDLSDFNSAVGVSMDVKYYENILKTLLDTNQFNKFINLHKLLKIVSRGYETLYENKQYKVLLSYCDANDKQMYIQKICATLTDPKEMEYYYLLIGDIKSIIMAYLQSKDYGSAMRIARNNKYKGQVAYLWVKEGEMPLEYSQIALEYAMGINDYETCLLLLPNHLNMAQVVYMRYGDELANQGKDQCVDFYLKCKSFEKIMVYYMKQHRVDDVIKIIKEHGIPKIAILREIEQMVKRGEYETVNDIGLKMNMVVDVVHVYMGCKLVDIGIGYCGKYVPEMVNTMQAKYGIQNNVKSPKMVRNSSGTVEMNDNTIKTLIMGKQVIKQEQMKQILQYLINTKNYSFNKVLMDKRLEYNKLYDYFDVLLLLNNREIMQNGKEMSFKINCSLLRYLNIIDVEMGIYDAGMSAMGFDDYLAFKLMNYYLDMCEGVEMRETTVQLEEIVQGTIKWPQMIKTTKQQRQEARDYVLKKSRDASVLVNNNKGYGCLKCKKLVQRHLLVCGNCKEVNKMCIVSGFGMINESCRCSTCQLGANKEDWNKYIKFRQCCPSCGSPETFK